MIDDHLCKMAILCSICYEDVKFGCEDVQAIAGCGHVFHELCLQQWLEYCPQNRIPTCPVCKTTCKRKDAHRLYFSSPDHTQASPSKEQHLEASFKVQKLEGKLAVTTLALQEHKLHLQQLDEQLVEHKKRLEVSGAAYLQANRERDACKETLRKTQEELRKFSAERSELIQKNTSLAKELASMKLVADVNLNEEDIVRLATIGQGRSKDDIIETLSKSLVLRNKTYKELMAKCNELGMSESIAVRKVEKAGEMVKRYKKRLQELENSAEVKENGDLRSSKKLCHEIKNQNPDALLRDLGTGKNAAVFAVASCAGNLVDESQKLETLASLHIRKETGERDGFCNPLPAGSGEGAWLDADQQANRKRVYAQTIKATSTPSSNGSFIVSGADGRGGRVTVLKPPQTMGFRNTIAPPQKPVKRLKTAAQTKSLHIEHFFSRSQ